MTQEAIHQVLELKRAGRFDAAVIELESLLIAEPRNALALAHLAHCQLRRNRLDDALAELDKSESAGGVTSFTARLRGDALYRLGRHADAARAYDEADALGDRSAWVLLQLARCHLRARRLDDARASATRALEREPGSAPAWAVLGDIAARSDDPTQAEKHYEHAHELDPDDQYAYARLMEARLLRLEPADREQEVKVLLRSGEGKNPYLSGVLARVRHELGDEAGAAAAWRTSQRPGNDLFGRKQEGYALRRAERFDEAAGVFLECLLKDPHDRVLFQTYVGMQRKRRALDDLRAGLEELLPVAGSRRGAVFGELRKLRSV